MMNNMRFPKVNYIGNKQKLSSWILDNFPVGSGKVLDLFAGGSSISFELKKRGFCVISNDALYASYVVNKSLIENSKVKLSYKEIKSVLSSEIDVETRDSIKWLENDLYYPYEVDELSKLVFFSKSLRGYKKFLMQALIRRSMIRKLPYSRMNINWNNIQKLRNEEYSYEKYGRRRAYHNEPFINHILNDLEEYNNAVFDNGKNNVVYQLDAINALKKVEKVDVVYLDPPYPGTMNNYDDFYGKFDRIFKKEISYQSLTNGSDFLIQLNKIAELASNKSDYLVLSLNSNSNPGFNLVVDIFRLYGKVTIKEKKHNYQISGKSKKNSNIEMLAIVEFCK